MQGITEILWMACNSLLILSNSAETPKTDMKHGEYGYVLPSHGLIIYSEFGDLKEVKKNGMVLTHERLN